MSQRAIECAVGKLVTDEEFRQAFYRHPQWASVEAGLELTAGELAALARIPRGALVALCARLDDRICRIRVPTPDEESDP